MKRFVFITIVLIVVASTSGCRRGLRLWGYRGAPCTPTSTPVPAATYAPALPQPVAIPVCPCPTAVPVQTYQPPPIDCGCATETTVPYIGGTTYADPAYSMGVPAYSMGVPADGTEVVSDTGFVVREGEYLSPNTAGASSTLPPASVAPALPAFGS